MQVRPTTRAVTSVLRASLLAGHFADEADEDDEGRVEEHRMEMPI